MLTFTQLNLITEPFTIENVFKTFAKSFSLLVSISGQIVSFMMIQLDKLLTNEIYLFKKR